MGSDPRWGGLWRHRDFRLLWIGETTSSVGDAVTTVALPLVAVTVVHASTFTIGVLSASAWLPWLGLGLVAGAWVDRVRRRRLMMACDATSMLVLLSVPVATWFGVLTVGQLVAVELLVGAAHMLFSTAYVAFLPTLVSSAELVEGNVKLTGSRSAAQIAGPGIAGLLAQLVGAAAGLLADAVTYVTSAVCLLFIERREPPPRPRHPTTNMVAEIAAGLRLVVGDPYMRVLAVFSAMGNLALTGWQTLEVVFLIRVVGVSSGTVGLLLAIIGVGGVCGAFFAGVVIRRIGSARGLIMCSLVALAEAAGNHVGDDEARRHDDPTDGEQRESWTWAGEGNEQPERRGGCCAPGRLPFLRCGVLPGSSSLDGGDSYYRNSATADAPVWPASQPAPHWPPSTPRTASPAS